MDFCAEPANLKITLEKIRTKFLTWIEGDLTKYDTELTEQYVEAVRQGEGIHLYIYFKFRYLLINLNCLAKTVNNGYTKFLSKISQGKIRVLR